MHLFFYSNTENVASRAQKCRCGDTFGKVNKDTSKYATLWIAHSSELWLFLFITGFYHSIRRRLVRDGVTGPRPVDVVPLLRRWGLALGTGEGRLLSEFSSCAQATATFQMDSKASGKCQ